MANDVLAFVGLCPPRIFLSALSAIDVALWDLRGKLLSQPVSVLLGGRRRQSVRTYASGMYFTETESLSERLTQEALGYKEQGFDAMKMKVGLNIEKDIENVHAVRQVIGSDIDLMIDANHAYSLTEAMKLARAVESSQISWFEEPVSPEYYSSYSQLRQTTSIPIAGGECEYLRCGFLRLFQQQCVDIAQPDICAAGGITEVKRIADMAYTFGVDLVPHTWGTGLATGMPMDKTLDSLLDGFADTLKWIGIVMVLGAVIGEILTETGGSFRIAESTFRLIGEKRVPFGMGFAAWIVTEANSALSTGIDTTNMIQTPAPSEVTMDWSRDFISDLVYQNGRDTATVV